MSTQARFRAGAIGHTGRGNFGHGLHLGFVGVSSVQPVAVADPDPAGRAAAQREIGAANAYADYREMLANESLDIVAVCPRYVDRHEELLMAAIDAGCHVYCEKPMTADLATADRVIDAAAAKGLKIAVAHQNVYLPQLRELRRRVADGLIGALQELRGTGKQDRRGGGEDMLVLGTHLFNTMRYFAGDVAWISGHVTVAGREIGPGDAREASEPIGLIAGDAITGYYRFAGGAVGTYASRANQPGKGRGFSLQLIGDRGSVAMRGAGDDFMIARHDHWAPWDGIDGWDPLDLGAFELHEDGNRLAIEDLIAAIDEDREPLAGARSARAALEMIHGVYASQLAGGRVAVPLADRGHPLARLRAG